MTMEMAKPRAEHGFLAKLVGTWDVTVPDMPAPDGEVAVPWREEVRSLDGLWFLCESRGQMPGGGGQASILMTLGFSAAKGRYVASWIGSMMDHLWVYEGDLEADGATLSLYTTGPSMDGKGLADYREQIAFQSDDHRIFRSSIKQPDGSWKPFMEAHYRRQ